MDARFDPQGGARAGAVDPPLSFVNHWIARVPAPTAGYFDTSYGSGPHADAAAYQPKAISGWETQWVFYSGKEAKGRTKQGSLVIEKETVHKMALFPGGSKRDGQDWWRDWWNDWWNDSSRSFACRCR